MEGRRGGARLRGRTRPHAYRYIHVLITIYVQLWGRREAGSWTAFCKRAMFSPVFWAPAPCTLLDHTQPTSYRSVSWVTTRFLEPLFAYHLCPMKLSPAGSNTFFWIFVLVPRILSDYTQLTSYRNFVWVTTRCLQSMLAHHFRPTKLSPVELEDTASQRKL